MTPLTMLAAELLLALSATPTGPARSVWQLVLLLVFVAVGTLAAAARPRQPKEQPTMPPTPTIDLRNLTPHPVTLMDTESVAMTIPPTGVVPRVPLTRQEIDVIGTRHGRVRMTETRRGAGVIGLPDPTDGVLLIVSRVTAEAAPDRLDLVFPDDLLRDAAGHVVGARALGRVRIDAGPVE